MRRTVHIDELRDHLNLVQQNLLHEKTDLFDMIPPGRVENREEYAFTYIRAERYGTKAIHHRLDSLDWLPLRVDPSPDMLGRKRTPLNRWINSYAAFEPDAVDFGNDFMHILTRAALRFGWESQEFLHTASRIARIFHDLSCLLNAAYFLTWMSENQIETVSLRLTDDILETVTEMARVVERPGLYVLSRGLPGLHGERARPSHHGHQRPRLHVIHTELDPHHPGRSR